MIASSVVVAVMTYIDGGDGNDGVSDVLYGGNGDDRMFGTIVMMTYLRGSPGNDRTLWW